MQQELEIKPELLRWARERANLQIEELCKNFPKIEAWESGKKKPTLKQLERFAAKVHAPIGYLFLDEPPIEALPIKDFRTLGSRSPRPGISVNSRDMIYICQQRQDWYHDYAVLNDMDRIDFVEQFKIENDAGIAAAKMRKSFALSLKEQFKVGDKDNFLRLLREKTEEAGILVMISGVVGSNNKRPLNIEEFRGFALCDCYAPLIFINGNDVTAGKIFTLAHELAHICLGETGLSDDKWRNGVEKWCNAFAAEFLVPAADLQKEYRKDTERAEEIERLARLFKVSRAVIVRRLYHIGLFSKNLFQSLASKAQKDDNEEKGRKKSSTSGGGDYYKTLPVRVSKRFLSALYTSTLEGQTLYRDALRMVGTAKITVFKEAAEQIKSAA